MMRELIPSILVVLFMTMIAGTTTAQQAPTREFGIRLTGLEDFDFVYKKENSENRYFRHRLGLANVGVTGNSSISIWSLGVGYAFGIEKRKVINDKLKFIHGFEPRISAGFVSTDSPTSFNQNNNLNFQLGLGYILGFQYDFAESFYVNIETIPSLTFRRYRTEQNDRLYGVSAGFNSNAVALTLAYRF